MPIDLVAAVAAVAAVATIAVQAPAADRDLPAIKSAMAVSAAGWNAGDVVRFMSVYSDRPTASFVTTRGILRGKAAMLESYRKHYDFADPSKRGDLSFETIDYRPLGARTALYIARYTLTYPGGKTESGLTSLVFEREAGGWKIIADYSS